VFGSVTAARGNFDPADGTGLEITLDSTLPPVLAVGPPTAIFCVGTCFHRHRRVADLTIVVDGMPHRPTAHRMPRLDRHRELHPTPLRATATSGERDSQSSRDPELRSYRSGFWATIPIAAREQPGIVEVGVEARLEDGTTESAAIAKIEVVERLEPLPLERPPATAAEPLIAVCMTTFNPNMELFRSQVDSIRAQTYRNWVCVISDDCSEPERFDQIVDYVDGDDRFLLSRSDQRRGFYRNFERALGIAPAEAEFVALCDQDDRWYPDKLEALREAIGSAGLAYSDLRRVDVEGRVRAETLWKGRRNNHTNLASLLISNSIVGASCLFHRRVIERALPFPSGPSWDFHDHWLVIVAMALGEVAYVARPLYDYVLHPGAVMGHVASKAPTPRAKPPLLDRWRAAYFNLYLQRQFHARLLLDLCRTELTPSKRRALRLITSADRSPFGFGWLALRPARALFGRTETLGVEAVMARGVLWRLLIVVRTGGRERPGRAKRDASPPDYEGQSLGRRQRRWLARTM
jgi:glycosyltransferase involved in cell wall biosynthesis